MDENILQAVKDAAISMLRGHEPDVDVYAEEIMRTDRTLEPENEDSSKWYFVEVIPTSFTTISPDQTEAALMVSVDYHEPEESYFPDLLALDPVRLTITCVLNIMKKFNPFRTYSFLIRAFSTAPSPKILWLCRSWDS